MHRTSLKSSRASMRMALAKGYKLLELAIVLVVVAGVSISLFTIMKHQATGQKIREQGQRIGVLNSALGLYMANHYKRLTEMDPACSALPFYMDGQAAPGLPSNCQLRDEAGQILANNGLQPTMQELVELNALPSSGKMALPLAVALQVLERTASSMGYAEPRWFFSIQRFCTADGSTAGPCKNGVYELKSLLFNTQPFISGADFAPLRTLFNSVGADAAISGMGAGRVNCSGRKGLLK